MELGLKVVSEASKTGGGQSYTRPFLGFDFRVGLDGVPYCVLAPRVD